MKAGLHIHTYIICVQTALLNKISLAWSVHVGMSIKLNVDKNDKINN